MKKKLFQHGNSLALIIDKPILKMLNITKETELMMKIEGNKLTIEPKETGEKQPTFKNKKLQKLHEEIIEKYAEAFEKLAK